MTKLGVVTCQILELEFSYLLSNDPNVSEIWVLNDPFSQELIKALENNGTKPVRCGPQFEPCDTPETDGIAVLVRVLEVGLHSVIRNLTQAVTACKITAERFYMKLMGSMK